MATVTIESSGQDAERLQAPADRTLLLALATAVNLGSIAFIVIAPLLAIAKVLPLYHGVQIVRPLVAGGPPPDLWLHAGVLLAYAAAGYALAIHFARRRFSS